METKIIVTNPEVFQHVKSVNTEKLSSSWSRRDYWDQKYYQADGTIEIVLKNGDKIIETSNSTCSWSDRRFEEEYGFKLAHDIQSIEFKPLSDEFKGGAIKSFSLYMSDLPKKTQEEVRRQGKELPDDGIIYNAFVNGKPLYNYYFIDGSYATYMMFNARKLFIEGVKRREDIKKTEKSFFVFNEGRGIRFSVGANCVFEYQHLSVV